MALDAKRKIGLIEIAFAIALLIVGLAGFVYAFLLRTQQPVMLDDDSVVSPSMEAMALYERVLSEPDPAQPGKRLFLNRILAGNEWIHAEGNKPAPVKLGSDGKLSWSCRASRNAMNQLDLRKDALPVHEYPKGQYQIAIFIYRDYQPENEQEPVAYYTGVINPEGGPTGPEKSADNPPQNGEGGLPDPEADYKRKHPPRK